MQGKIVLLDITGKNLPIGDPYLVIHSPCALSHAKTSAETKVRMILLLLLLMKFMNFLFRHLLLNGMKF